MFLKKYLLPMQFMVQKKEGKNETYKRSAKEFESLTSAVMKSNHVEKDLWILDVF